VKAIINPPLLWVVGRGLGERVVGALWALSIYLILEIEGN